MTKGLLPVCLIFMVLVTPVYAQTSTQDKASKVTNLLNGTPPDFTANLPIESSKQFKAISGFTQNATESNSSKGAANPQNNEQVNPEQASPGPLLNSTEQGPEENLKILGSK